MISRRRAAFATLCTFVLALTVGLGACSTPESPPRTVAVGDVHGSFEGLTGILQAAGLIDAEHMWIGGRTTFVQTGDIYDRGTGQRQALDLVMRLEGEAAQAGGRVEPLMGNHEVVNILGDFRDVSPEAFARFANAQSESRRVRAYDDIVEAAASRGQESTVPDRDTWMTAHPPGFIEYTESVGPDGTYGQWIRTHKVVGVVGNTAFMHAGINHEFQGSIDDVNRTVAEEIAAWDATKAAMVEARLIPSFATMAETVAAATAEIERLSPAGSAGDDQTELDATTRQFVDRLKRTAAIEQSSLLVENGPMWFRGFALWNEETDKAPFMALIGRLGIDRFVAGHTPMPGRRIRHRWDHRVFQIDTGMLGGDFFEGGRASALELVGDRITAIYTDRTDVVVAGTGDAKDD